MTSADITTIGELIELYNGPDAQVLYDEVVTEHQHALQCAACAVADGAPPALIAAALLHDVGHLVLRDNQPIDIALDRDHHHDRAGATLLARWFDESVTEPVRLHVTAKRYLCAVEPDYAAGLSASSVRSLVVQGGAMSPVEVADFERVPRWADAVAVRRWDDHGKVADLDLCSFESYGPMLNSLAISY